jgi:hypothetical protein
MRITVKDQAQAAQVALQSGTGHELRAIGNGRQKKRR